MKYKVSWAKLAVCCVLSWIILMLDVTFPLNIMLNNERLFVVVVSIGVFSAIGFVIMLLWLIARKYNEESEVISTDSIDIQIK